METDLQNFTNKMTILMDVFLYEDERKPERDEGLIVLMSENGVEMIVAKKTKQQTRKSCRRRKITI
jgi:hypothetical protein